MTVFLAELFGTFILILLGNGVVATTLLNGSKGQNGGWIAITAGWGFAVAIAVYSVAWITGGHVNPAVTFGLAIAEITPWDKVPHYIAGQMVGAMLGAAAVWLAYFLHWPKTTDKNVKLLCFCTKPILRKMWWNLITEVIATAVLLIGILSIFYFYEKIGSMALDPYMYGILIFSIGLSLGGPTGFAINPARDLGPRLMHQWLPIEGKGDSDWGYAWIPILGPFVGAALGSWIYSWLIVPMLPI